MLDIQKIYEELTSQIDKDRITLDKDMSTQTSFKAGGKAALYIEPGNAHELAAAIKLLNAYGIKHLVMGNGTNLLVKDSGFNGAIVKLGDAFSQIKVSNTRIHAGSGALMSLIAKEALEASLEGFEFAGGIPGSIGGAAFMNAGAYDGEISQIIESAEVMTRDGEEIYQLSNEEMKLSYRHSIFQENGDIVLGVTLLLKKGDQDKIRAKMQDLTARRTSKQPLAYPSAGSFFKRPKGYFAGKLIQDAGLRGLSLGGAQVSPLHAGFIINTGGATATDIINLMEVVRNTVYDASGVMLEPEVRIIGD